MLLGVSDSVVSNVPLCFVYSSEGAREAGPPFEWELAMAGRSGSFLFFSDVHRFFKPQTHKHWIPRRLRLTSQLNKVASVRVKVSKRLKSALHESREVTENVNESRAVKQLRIFRWKNFWNATVRPKES